MIKTTDMISNGENALHAAKQIALHRKDEHRRRLIALSIDEKIKIVESLRERLKPIREARRSITDKH